MIEAWYFDIPVVTRTYLTLIFLTTLACKLEMVSPIHLFYSWELVYKRRQYYRLITTFLYYGQFSFDFIFHMFFLSRYSRMLEEGSFRGNAINYTWMLTIGSTAILTLSTLVALVTTKQFNFLANALSHMMIYVWARRNPQARMNFLGVFNFNAPYLPWVLLGFPFVLNGQMPWHDIPGLLVGHLYYFFEDVYPRLDGMQGKKYLATPRWFKMLFMGFGRDVNDAEMVRVETIGEQVPVGDDGERDLVEGAVDDKEEWRDLNADTIKDKNEDVDPGGYKWSDKDKKTDVKEVKEMKNEVVTEVDIEKEDEKEDVIRQRNTGSVQE